MKLTDVELAYPEDIIIVFIDGRRIVNPLEADNKEGWVDIYDETKIPNDIPEEQVDIIEGDIPDPIDIPIKRIYGQISFKRMVYAPKKQ